MSRKKTLIKKGISINAPIEKVWAALADFGEVQKLSPNIAKSYLTSEVKNGVGATRHCDFSAMGAEVEEKITEWNEGKSLRIQFYDTKRMPMIVDIEAWFEVKESEGVTILEGTFEYGMSNAFGAMMNGLTMRKMNEKSWVKLMAGIKYHVETGVLVNKETDLPLNMVEEL